MADNKELPELIQINLDFKIDREWYEEYCLEDGQQPTLQGMIDALRNVAHEMLRDDAYNLVETADILDESYSPV